MVARASFRAVRNRRGNRAVSRETRTCTCIRAREPSQPPKLSEMVRMVAQLGGYVNRKRKDEPGPQTVWLGLQRLHDIALCWQLFGPEAKTDEILV